MGRSLLLKRAGLFDNPGEIPDEGGRGQECVTPGLLLLVVVPAWCFTESLFRVTWST